MKKTVLLSICVILLLLTFSGCGGCSTPEPPEETVIELFKKCADIKNRYSYEEAGDALNEDFDGKAFLINPDGSYNFSGQREIDGIIYRKTTLKYSEAVDKYSEVFTGKALDSFIARFFRDMGGDLYVTTVGGASGFDTVNIAVTYEGISDGAFIYNATYYFDVGWGVEETGDISSCRIEVKETEAGYRISYTDYLSGTTTD